MSNELRKVFIPNDVVERLTRANPTSELIRDFYPLIAQFAGRQSFAMSIPLMFIQQIDTYVEQHCYSSKIYNQLIINIPDWIDALLDDTEAANEAKAQYYNAVKYATGKEND